MSSIAVLWSDRRKLGFLIPAVCATLLLAFVLMPDLHRVSLNQAFVAPAPQPYLAGSEPHTAALSVSEFSSVAVHQERIPADAQTSESAAADHKIVRIGSLEAIVKSPEETAEKIRLITTRLGGYIESAQLSGNAGFSSAAITMRVPASRFDDARQAIRNLCQRLDSDKTGTSDVTRQYVDMEARLRNLRAEEAQYLQIMRSAGKVKDMLEVSDKIGQVRGEMEQQQAEFQALSRQVETATLTVSLRAEPVAQVTSQRWRPLYEIRVAARDALDGLANYAAVMLAFIFEIPVAVLWLATLLLVVAGAWKILRWAARVFFHYPRPLAENPSAEA